jgi:ubiquinone/menaquinone biosynthesis C-methylase UbiE
LDARISQNSIGPLYDRKASVYDMWGILTETRARKRALELADIHDGQDILEVAVGTGLAFRDIVKRNPHGTNFGIDISPGMLSKARKRMERLAERNYTLSEGTALGLDAEDESFDTLVNNYMFDLIEFNTMGAILTEFNRVLKKGGKLILVNMTLGERFGSRFYDWIYRISPKTMGGCRGVRMADILPQYGFKVELREYHQQLRFPSEVILALKSGPVSVD